MSPVADRPTTPEHADKPDPPAKTGSGRFVDDAVIEGIRMSVIFAPAIIDARETRSIGEASTVAIDVTDPSAELVNSDLWKQASRLSFGDNDYTFVQTAMDRAARTLGLTFEDTIVYTLRQYDKPRKAWRSRINRIDFARSLCREAGVKFYCPDVAPRSPLVQTTTTTPTAATGGFEAGAKITVTNHGHPPGNFAPGGARPWIPASSEQRDNLERALSIAVKLGCTDTMMVAMVMAGTGESAWHRRAHDPGNPHYGLFQQSPLYYTRPDSYNVDIAVHEFLVGGKTWGITNTPQAGSMMALLKGYQGKVPLGQIIQARQRANPSDVGNGAYYQAFFEESRVTVASFSHPGTHNTRVLKDRFIFYRGRSGQREDSWQVLQRIFQEIGWRCFVGPDPRTGKRDTIWAASDPWLFGAKSAVQLDMLTEGVEGIRWKIDANARVVVDRAGKTRPEGIASLQIDVDDTWGLNPGIPIMLSELEGHAAGKWLLTDWERDLFAPTGRLAAEKPSPPLPEPVDTSGPTPPGTPPAGRVPHARLPTDAVYPVGAGVAAWAETYPAPPPAYLWGAKHGASLFEIIQNPHPPPPFDCSSFVRWGWGAIGKIDIAAAGFGNNTYGLIDSAKKMPLVIWGGAGTAPKDGWHAGDVVFTSGGEHVVVMVNSTEVVNAKGRLYGIVREPLTAKGPVYFWARYEKAAKAGNQTTAHA